MLKFILAGRHPATGTQERYFYEWSIIHVALMISNPATTKVFQRYAQHYTINGVSNDLLWFPLSPMTDRLKRRLLHPGSSHHRS